MVSTRASRLLIGAVLFFGALACRTSDVFVAMATVTPTRTSRPTFTPIPPATDTPVPTNTATRAPAPSVSPTSTKGPTARPATRRPATSAPAPTVPPAQPQPTVSTYEYHVNPATCGHSGLTFIKGTVYLDRYDPSQKYIGAVVALGDPNGGAVYQMVKTDDYGEYTFVLSDMGQGRQGRWGVWLVTPSGQRKSDIGGPIVTNGLPASDPNACWAGSVDFWK